MGSLVLGVFLLGGLPPAAPAHRIAVSPRGPVATLREALRIAAPGDTIVLAGGLYREARIEIGMPLTILGQGGPVLDGGGEPVLIVRADGVTIRGLTLRNVEPSHVEDRAGIRLEGVRDCTVADNRLLDTFFGVYAARSSDCAILRNIIVARPRSESASGNAIHLFSSRGFTVEGNRISGHRDGIYLEFSRRAGIRGNDSRANRRYGLHFMYSDSCDYERNSFVRNGAGVAVMYSRMVTMTENRFEDNWGPAAYGLLLKEIKDAWVTRNVFVRNTVGLFAEGSDRLIVTGNEFLRNGWAARLMADATGNRFVRNRFQGNSFDVSTNSRRTPPGQFAENYWDGYVGYDLDRDGYGDVPHRPVRLFALLVERHEPTLILLRSLFLELLELAERVAPVLTPEALVDARPLMRWEAS